MISKTVLATLVAAIVVLPSFARSPSAERVHRSGLHFVGPESYQGQPVSPAEREAWQEALVLAAEHPDDFGYPYFSGGKLTVRAVTSAGSQLAAAIESSVSTQVAKVTTSYAELERIKDDVMLLRNEDVPGADAIVMSQPDDENNRVIVTVTREEEGLIVALEALYGAEMIAIRVDEAALFETSSRKADTAPFDGGALYISPAPDNYACSLGIPWTTGFVTAGHCIPDGGSSKDFASRYLGSTPSGTRENWHRSFGTLFMGDTTYRGDLALIEMPSPESNVEAAIYVGTSSSSTTRPVTDSWKVSPVVGDQYCTGGQVTGELCGFVVAIARTNVKYAEEGPAVVGRNLTVGTSNSWRTVKGDSGGPVYTVRSDGTIAVKGIISGGTKDGVPPPYRSIFTDIRLAVGAFPGTAKTTNVSIPFEVSNRNSSKCLNVEGGSENGAQVGQWDCHGTNNQRWYYEAHPVNPYAVRIINGSGKCLAIGSSSTANGAKAIQWDCIDSSKGQTWYRQWDGTIVNYSGKCLAIGSSSLVNGADAIQWDCIGTLTQMWNWSSWGSVP